MRKNSGNRIGVCKYIGALTFSAEVQKSAGDFSHDLDFRIIPKLRQTAK